MTDIRKLMFTRSDYLDFLSVVEGLRGVALIQICNKSLVRVEKTGCPVFKNTNKQFEQIQNYLRKNHPDCILIKDKYNHAFLARKDKVKDVKEYIEKHKRGNWGQVREQDLGELLSFPTCCIKEFTRPTPYLPFRPCSRKCELEWSKKYSKLEKQYESELNKNN